MMGVAQHSETGEALVVCRPDYGERGLWVRPLTMFIETVETRVGHYHTLGGLPRVNSRLDLAEPSHL